MNYENIRREAKTLWDEVAKLVSGDNFLIIYLEQTSLREAMTTLDIDRREYTMLMTLKDDMK